ncbi:unnamed protein product [Kluyveromyces dobzhanskii CBS 2104]|uniref:WGS project CCBQ000000000 data, contig 00008 n=1 Tax=Kluyveromyces dobzhanskii CBS 2104 TaxID=1427455 RepID=A0A0A8L726_9SACH|nr:unnamed protein product [Kluyveromyces dobzhanskii CBS 2104]
MPLLRDYQQDCIDKCVDAVTQGKMRIGVSLATGGGKTVIFSNLLDRFRSLDVNSTGTALILVHRRELAMQAASTISRFMPDLNIQMEMGKLHANLGEADVVIGSVLTMVRRLEDYPPNSIDLIVIDEAHHAVADSYVKILAHFNADTPATTVPVIGFSATFERADKKALSAVMDEIIYHKGILEMIDENWLCEGKFTTVDVGADLSKVKSVNSDFQLEGLSKVMNTKEINEIVLNTYLHKMKLHNLKSTLLFAVDVAHCKSLFETFQRAGINAQYVTGKTRTSERDAIVSDFKDGKIQVLMNCGIFTEGTDIPNVDCILLCRPTKSRSLLVQMIGRGLRKHHTKEYCQIIDFVSSSKVGVVSVPTLAGIEDYEGNLDEITMEEINLLKQEIEQKQLQQEMLQKEEEIREKEIKSDYKHFVLDSDSIELTLTNFEDFKSFCESMGETDISKLSPAAKEARLLADSKYPWVPISKVAWCFPLLPGRHLRIEKETNANKDRIYSAKLYIRIYADRKSGPAYAPYRIINVFTSPDLEAVFNTLEAFVSKMSANSTMSCSKFAPWRKQPASPKQKAVIKPLFDRVIATEEKFADMAPNVDAYLKTLNKGGASSILFATSLAPKYPVKRILKLLSWRNAQSQQE